MSPNGLLILTQPLRLLGRNIDALIQSASSHVRNVLYVHLAPGAHFTKSIPSPPQLVPSTDISKAVLQIYGGSANLCSDLDVRVLLGNFHSPPHVALAQTLSKPLHVVLCDGKADATFLTKYAAKYFNASNFEVKILDGEFEDEEVVASDEAIETYKHVCLGGTFDRIHTGHKILLSEACVRCQDAITIGVTDGPMIESKTLHDLIEPTTTRISTVKSLISDIRPSITSDVVPIIDPFGPSIVKPDIECLVVSDETLRGGNAVNKKRVEKGLQEVEIFVIELLEDKCRSEDEEVKISSSSQRKRILGSLLREPNVVQRTDAYIIGVTGSIASGKTSVCSRLTNLGAVSIDCDKLGHKAYEPDREAYEALVEEFGQEILNAETKEIDRMKLGSCVFNDDAKREKLNSIVWPAVANLAKEEVAKLIKQGHRVIFLEAALLIEAGWSSWLNELWVTFIPKKEAVARIMERNNLPEDAALKRVQSQSSNAERIQHAHVVLSTMWETEITQKQVEKAWKSLQKRLPKY
ncbi:hypothetical protein CAPTEDRAFT_149109 [Capitella teleta]|uniref:Bifunctional coenzyme A synthase n=1 Tax=Capitella teleta TaxID=283909 RepID=X1Z5E1_CAPTE|nr:hypothetical protein CAPTEDRAFT_149109 [Capitella teleta]|eukprot:ELU10151.1 hypothetical protein CAPTEDRAFT_149109 [Capitella teleta]